MSKARDLADLGSNDVLETTSTGVDVTGTVTADGLTLNSGGFDYINSGSFLYTNVPSGYSTTIQAGGLNVAKFSSGGDISFYDTAGTTAKFFWDASAESLGIGTSSPSAQLDVIGNIKSSGSATIGGGVYTSNGSAGFPVHTFSGDNDTGMYQAGANQLGFTTGGSEAMRIDSSGNVGIGTSSPVGRLEVEDNNTGALVLLKVTADDSSPYGVVVGNDTYSTNDTDGISLYTRNNGEAVVRANGTDSVLELNVQGTQAVTIDSAGRVTMPYQPSFEAVMSSSWTLASNSTVPFGSTAYNEGNHYSTSTNRFTAPVAGKYLFYIHTYTAVQSGNVRAMHFKFGKNGDSHFKDLTTGGYTDDGGLSYHPAVVGTVVMDLQANDYVYIYFSNGTYASDTFLAHTQTYWGGYLIG